MKKIRTLILILSLIPCILSSQSLMVTPQQKDNRNHSKQLIEHYNKLRSNRALPNIIRDSVIDDVTNEILFDKRYKKSDSEYNEDSIRFLFYNKGMMDYKFETKEILDKDTSVEFNAFILADSSSNIRMGYSNYGNKHLLIKTKSYLKYEFGEVYVPQVSIERKKKDFPKAEGKIKIDSVVFYVKCIIPGKYYYHYLNHIPSSLEPVGSGHKYEVKESNKRNPFNKELNNTYPCMILSSEQPDMYLIVTNEKNEIIAILK